MENKKLYLLATYYDSVSDEPSCPYPPIEINTVIEKDELTNQFHYIDFGIEGSPWREEIIYETFEEAFNYFYEYKMGFYLFKIVEIEFGKKFLYTKKLIEKLNTDQYKKIKNIPIESFKEHLGIEIKLVENANKKNIRKINLIKNINISGEMKSFFVGKIGIDGSIITIKNENEEIIFLTSSENLTIETEEIKEDYYWYFKK